MNRQTDTTESFTFPHYVEAGNKGILKFQAVHHWIQLFQGDGDIFVCVSSTKATEFVFTFSVNMKAEG